MWNWMRLFVQHAASKQVLWASKSAATMLVILAGSSHCCLLQAMQAVRAWLVLHDCTINTQTTISGAAMAFPQQPLVVGLSLQKSYCRRSLIKDVDHPTSKQMRRGLKQRWWYALHCTTNISRMISRKAGRTNSCSKSQEACRTQQLSHCPLTRLLQT